MLYVCVGDVMDVFCLCCDSCMGSLHTHPLYPHPLYTHPLYTHPLYTYPLHHHICKR